ELIAGQTGGREQGEFLHGRQWGGDTGSGLGGDGSWRIDGRTAGVGPDTVPDEADDDADTNDEASRWTFVAADSRRGRCGSGSGFRMHDAPYGGDGAIISGTHGWGRLHDTAASRIPRGNDKTLGPHFRD